MGTKYSQLTEHDRVYIDVLLQRGVTPRGVALALRRHHSTIYREIRRGTPESFGRYMSALGQSVRSQRRRNAGLARRKLGQDLSAPAWQPVLAGLHAFWSPEQICGRMRLPDFLLGPTPACRLSHETIYKAIHALPPSPQRHALTSRLRHSRGGRRRSRLRKQRFTALQNITPIDLRPLEAASRLLPGHWEGDLMKGAGGKSCIGTLVERTSRLVLIVPLRSASAMEVYRAFARRLRHLPAHLRLSLTYDRGSEMALHERLSKSLNMPIYFCRPYCPWQRGSNENTNGLLRQFLPKGVDLSSLSPPELARIEASMNNRPRRTLGFRTPLEVFNQHLAAIAA
jgi:transposase, IS30 family